MCWIFMPTEGSLWTVGFFAPDGKFFTDSDWSRLEEAAFRVHWLNGGHRK